MTSIHARAAAAALALGALLGGCSGSGPSSGGSPAPTASAAPTPTPTATVVPIHVHSSRVGKQYITITEQARNRRVYVLRADKQTGSYLGTGSAISDFVNPHIIFYDKDGKTLTADAPKAHAVEADHSVLMTGGVRAVNGEGLVLTCDQMLYNAQKDTITGTGDVVVTTNDGGRYTGQRIDADLRFSQMTMSPQ